MALRKAREGEQLVAGLFQAVGDGLAFQPPFADERLAFRFDLLLRRSVDHILVVVRDFLVQPLRRMGQQIAMLMHRAALNRHIGPQRGERVLEPRRAVDDDEFRRLQSALDKIVEQRPPGGLALSAHVLDRKQNFLPDLSHASATRSEIEVAFLSSRTRTTVPSRMRRMIGSAASERAFQASKSPFTLRQVRLTTSLPTAPAKPISTRGALGAWRRLHSRSPCVVRSAAATRRHPAPLPASSR
ncbi:MAG: hypothetical protein USCAAHI_01783 [Beijerinckiaceae bacterium]|nr:MAG: hypothetical protein USCAAHI_01783 [Beijerinckiaceae bacterium]